jgi:hypothetical protein
LNAFQQGEFHPARRLDRKLLILLRVQLAAAIVLACKLFSLNNLYDADWSKRFFRFFPCPSGKKALKLFVLAGASGAHLEPRNGATRRVSRESFPLILESNQLALKNLGHKSFY